MGVLYKGNQRISPVVTVKTPTPMSNTIQLIKDQNGKLIKGNTELFDFSGVTDIDESILLNLYKNDTSISGEVDMSDLVQITGESALRNAFSGCTNITSVKLGNLSKVTVAGAMNSAFQDCTGITGALDLSSLKVVYHPKFYSYDDVSASNSVCSYAFKGCTGITSVDLSSLAMIVGKYCCNQMFYGCSSLTSADLSSLTCIAGAGVISGMFSSCPNLTTIDLSSLTFVFGYANDYYMASGNFNNPLMTSVNLNNLFSLGYYMDGYSLFYNSKITEMNFPKLGHLKDNACYQMFSNCRNLTDVRFYAVTADSFISTNSLTNSMLSGCTGVTVHFPSNLDPQNGSTVISSQNGYPNFGGTNTVLAFDLPVPGDIQVSINKITEVENEHILQNALGGISRTFAVDWSGLTYVSGDSCCYGMFNNSVGLKSISLSGLTSISGTNACQNMFSGCTTLTTMNFASLENIIGSYCCYQMFNGCTSLQTLYFPALTTTSFGNTSKNQFYNMLQGVTGCTIHFPSNLDPQNGSTVISSLSTYPNFGGTNTTLAFDLTATN